MKLKLLRNGLPDPIRWGGLGVNSYAQITEIADLRATNDLACLVLRTRRRLMALSKCAIHDWS